MKSFLLLKNLSFFLQVFAGFVIANISDLFSKKLGL